MKSIFILLDSIITIYLWIIIININTYKSIILSIKLITACVIFSPHK